MKWKVNFHQLVYLAIIVGYILSFKFIPMQDFPDWFYQSWLFSGMLQEKIHLTIHSYIAPNITTTLILGGLCYFIPPFIAAKCFLILVSIFLYTGILAFLRQFHPDESDTKLLIPLAFLWTFNFNFFHGNLSFIFSLGLCFHAIARLQKNMPTYFTLFLTHFILYATHFFGWFLYSLTTLIHLAWKKDINNIRKFIVSFSPVMIIFLHYLYTKEPITPTQIPHLSFLKLCYEKCGLIFFILKPFPTFRDIWPETLWIKGLNLVWFFGYGLMGIYAVKLAKDIFRKDERPLIIIVLIFLYFLMPLETHDVVRPGERLLLMILCYITTLGIPVFKKIDSGFTWLVGASFLMILIPTQKFNEAMQQNAPLMPYKKSAHNPFTARPYYRAIENNNMYQRLPFFETGFLSK
ncbi:MAG: hypothetical protein EXS67_00195 [Candidatus Margulisbacteria bacterium]|nr:hypothetical protein [Candidatus Margulisiibacteriota bacterium]